MFAEKGFTCLETDLSSPKLQVLSSEALMSHFESGVVDADCRHHINNLDTWI